MKLQRHNSTSGGVLVVMLIISALVGIMLVAYLSMLSSQHKMSERSQVWNNTIVMSEIGIEEALAHLNQVNSTTNFATNGWARLGTNYVRTRANFINGGTIGMAIDNLMPPTITSTGWLRTPLQTVSMKRIVRVKTRINIQFPDGVLSKGPIILGGNNGKLDSYNSTNSLFSSNGMYVASMADDNMTIATTSQSAGAIQVGNMSVFGNVATGPNGTVTINANGNVGDITYNNNSANDGTIQGGHLTDDVNVYIPDGILPTDFVIASATIPSLNPPAVNGTNYAYVLTGGDYRINNVLNLSAANQAILVTGKVRLYCSQPITMSGQAYVLIGTNGLASNASLEWYCAQNIDISGQGILNGTSLAKNLSIIGLNTCTSVRYSGLSSFTGTIYAPRAAITMGGNADAYGAFVGASFSMSGNMSVHYDEALAGDPRKSRFVAASWQEL